MHDYIQQLRDAVEHASVGLLAIPADESGRRPSSGQWSPREVIGHLVDSAANNHQRFVRAQFTDDLVFAGYAQNDWVRVQRHQDAPWRDLVGLWRAYNLHLARVMEAVPGADRARPRAKHNLDAIAWKPFSPEQPASLGDLMADYVDHLEHHLGQIPGSGRGQSTSGSAARKIP